MIFSILLSLILFNSTVHASDGFQKYYEKIQNYCEKDGALICLASLLKYKCGTYAGPTFLIQSRFWDCAYSAGALARNLNVNTPPGVPNYIAFSERLSKLLNDKNIKNYLDSIPLEIQKSYRTLLPFNLWTHTMNYVQQDRTRALEWLAVLFQDTSEDEILTAFYSENPLAPKWKEVLLALGPRESSPLIEYYPPEIERSSLNSGFYHFYLTAFLASLLKEERVEKPYFLPFLFNAVYEFSEIGGDDQYFKDPKPFSISGNLWKMHDLYAGYLGGHFGGSSLKKALSFQYFSVVLSADPHGTIQDWFNE